MEKKTAIGIDAWNGAIGGKSKNSVGDGEIKRMAENGELVVVDHDGNRFEPTVLDDGSWDLKPITTMEISFQEWVSDAGAGMDGTPRFEELHKAAEKGNLVVIDNDGNRLVPVRFGENWKLEPEKK